MILKSFSILKGLKGVDITIFKLFLLLYADDITIFAETAQGLQKGNRYFKGILC